MRADIHGFALREFEIFTITPYAQGLVAVSDFGVGTEAARDYFRRLAVGQVAAPRSFGWRVSARARRRG